MTPKQITRLELIATIVYYFSGFAFGYYLSAIGYSFITLQFWCLALIMSCLILSGKILTKVNLNKYLARRKQ